MRLQRPDKSRAGVKSWIVLAFVATLALFSASALAVYSYPFKNHAEELRFQALTGQLRCVVCQNESLADSTAPLADDLRRDIFKQMSAGKSDAQIKAWLTARYSDYVLYDPPLRGATWLLWFGPLLLLIAGGAVVCVIVRRRAQAAALGPMKARPASDVEDDW